jgi:hypothetical protein
VGIAKKSRQDFRRPFSSHACFAEHSTSKRPRGGCSGGIALAASLGGIKAIIPVETLCIALAEQSGLLRRLLLDVVGSTWACTWASAAWVGGIFMIKASQDWFLSLRDHLVRFWGRPLGWGAVRTQSLPSTERQSGTSPIPSALTSGSGLCSCQISLQASRLVDCNWRRCPLRLLEPGRQVADKAPVRLCLRNLLRQAKDTSLWSGI